MKKTFCALLSILIVTLCLPGIFIPADAQEETFTPNLAEVATDIEQKMAEANPLTAQKFTAYLETLTPERKEMILDDPQMVTMMLMDGYWEAPGGKSKNQARTSSPVDSYYSVGTYFNRHHTSKCTCHGNGSNACTYPPGYDYCCSGTGDCIRYDGTGAIQCKGFADYIYNKWTGHDPTNAYAVALLPSKITNDTQGAQDMEDFMSALPIGSNIRLKMRAGGNHSIIIQAKSDTGITIYDANYSNTQPCIIKSYTWTWSTLAQKCSGIVAAWRG